jgi:hypothetical protein
LHLTVLYYILCVATIGDAGAEQVTMMMGLAATFLSDWEIHPWHPAADKCICADTRLIVSGSVFTCVDIVFYDI